MECELIRPAVLGEALAARQQYGADCLPIAGGQSLLVMLRNRLVSPKALIDLEPLMSFAASNRGRTGFRSGR
jgi:CO/xanthine dehydrogenase FAD-binding subunit